jgi:hypothetical protein
MKLFNEISIILAVPSQSPYSEARQTYQQTTGAAQVRVAPTPTTATKIPVTPPVGATTPVQDQRLVTTAKQLEFFKKKSEKDKEATRAKIFKNLLISSIILIIIGIILAAVLLPLTTQTPEEVEDETANKTPEELKGKSWTMLGTIKTKEEFEVDGQKVYGYEFEDTDLKFKSSEDIGDEGETVIITIENTQLEPLEATLPENVMVYYLPGIILIIIGIVHVVFAVYIKWFRKT